MNWHRDPPPGIDERAHRQFGREQQKQIEEMVGNVIGSVFEKAIAYVNVIMAASYAGAFTVWSLTKDQIFERASILVALLLTFSLFMFSAWEVFKMLYTSFDVKALYNRLGPPMEPNQFNQAVAEILSKSRRQQGRLAVAWIAVLFLTIIPAFSAGVLLMFNFVARLVNQPGWPA